MTYIVFLAYEIKDNAEWAKTKLAKICLFPDIVEVSQKEWLDLDRRKVVGNPK